MKIKNVFTTIDTHTEGGVTRIITSGVPKLSGKTITEKVESFRREFDGVRKLLMCEPRGHRDMYGAVITESTNPQADIGVFFLKYSGYLDMCVHGAMGVAAAGLETGFIAKRPGNAIRLETPAGLFSVRTKRGGLKPEPVTLQTNPIFVHTQEADLDVGLKRPIPISIVFSDVFFVLTDAKKLNLKVMKENVGKLREVGMKIVELANQSFTVYHPDNPNIHTLEAVIFSDDIGKRHGLNIMISRKGGIDWSPCGAGTGAKMTHLFVSNRLRLREDYVNQSLIGTKFTGRLIQRVKVGPYKGAVAEITGSTYITGIHQFLIDEDDPFGEGFSLG